MELSDLKVFQAIAEEASISGAAKRLDYVQSNVTARLRKLEEELGVVLFRRTVKGMTITEKGQLFRRYADSILQMADEAVMAVQEQDQPGGTLRIGVVETVTCGNFMNLLAAYQAQNEQVSLRLETGNPLQLMEKVKNYELDGALVTGDIPKTAFILDYVQTDEVVLLSGKAIDFGNTRNAEEAMEISALSAIKWAVSQEGCPFRSRLARWLKDEQAALTNFIEISSLETLLSSVKEGLACTLLPKSVLSGSYEHLHVTPVPAPYTFIETGLIRRQDKYVSRAYKAFAELVREQGL
ncbi:LysR family transcriptional regulator [Paenibacillus senegalensis]|uniref:LysR family transcriptional regulator n=1 Tax=Paenibacillus senegalensis TaxID=1465766 RepID=UPI000288F848|nr:LysR family transcriptional regulator [Paenibacillus senegalensis]